MSYHIWIPSCPTCWVGIILAELFLLILLSLSYRKLLKLTLEFSDRRSDWEEHVRQTAVILETSAIKLSEIRSQIAHWTQRSWKVNMAKWGVTAFLNRFSDSDLETKGEFP
ncbi:MAG: hypothetical protein K2X01_09475 [Cyanobacteria bacterium]|nr:hypothetical protein [Cyanobacteriota bacterium]